MSEPAASVEPKSTVRPTKKQKELLTFIEDFIAEHGYSPSYREIMKGTGHTSVATVSLHINSLVKRGHLIKRDHSARSLEVVNPNNRDHATIEPKQLKVSEEKWLVSKIELFFKEAEAALHLAEQDFDKLQVLVDALRVLGLSGASQVYSKRLGELKKQDEQNQYSV